MHDLTLETTGSVPSAHDQAFSQRAMLRITITTRPEGVTVVLEGGLAGPWADELARCWEGPDGHAGCGLSLRPARRRDIHRCRRQGTAPDDAHGGATLAASGCMTRAILEEIGKNW